MRQLLGCVTRVLRPVVFFIVAQRAFANGQTCACCSAPQMLWRARGCDRQKWLSHFSPTTPRTPPHPSVITQTLHRTCWPWIVHQPHCIHFAPRPLHYPARFLSWCVRLGFRISPAQYEQMSSCWVLRPPHPHALSCTPPTHGTVLCVVFACSRPTEVI